ncbi:MAG: adenosine kinase [Acidobacteria bacterium]|nr:adenosine kinase [Acidobacteriota bacterium]
MTRHDVFGMCNALYDAQAEVDDAFLARLGLAKGTMQLVDEAREAQLLPLVEPHLVHHEAGGSGANTMIGLALLGGQACFTSRVGADRFGGLYRESLARQGVQANLGAGRGRTGVALILITPDAQRTILTYRWLYLTGYLWDTDSQKEAFLFALAAARRAGVKVAFNLSDPFCVNRHLDDFRRLTGLDGRRGVDLVVGNAEEAKMLTGEHDALAAARALAARNGLAAVTRDAAGSVIDDGGEAHAVPAFPVRAVDTTGAGDMFAAGLLYGLTHGLSLPAAGRVGSYAAAQVVAKLGPRLESIDLGAVTELSR